LEAVPPETVGTTIVNVWEQLKGWLANINKEKLTIRQVPAFRELGRLIEFYSDYHIAPFDTGAATLFDSWRKAKIRISTSDLKIASVAVTQNALLLTANKIDFEQVPGLRFENWLD
jgi:tRNA(fMet)-specific endonuclease VapC